MKTLRALTFALTAASLPLSAVAHECPPIGGWMDVQTGARVSAADAIDRLAEADVVLLGESHGYRDIHLWQATAGAAVADRRGRAQFGYEMLPRRAQAALDAWAAGESSRHAFLAQAGWSEAWGFGADAYDPILRLPRLLGAPGIALNVDRSLVRRVGREGWASVPEAERFGLSDPAPALPAYMETLDVVLQQKNAAGDDKQPDAEATAKAATMRLRFAEAQLVWDRAFAEAIKGGLEHDPAAPVVAFMGRGHVEYGHGVAHQLADLGVFSVASAIAVFVDEACALEADSAGRPIADLVFGVAPPPPEPPPPARPKIGVYIKNAPESGGAEITKVSEASPAEDAGIQVGDVVTEAAGQKVATAAELGAAIRAHFWGAWLPLVIKRDGQDIEVVAKLPKAPAH